MFDASLEWEVGQRTGVAWGATERGELKMNVLPVIASVFYCL